MGLTYVDLTLTNNGLLGHGKTCVVKALVDTGADHLVITRDVARALGYDLDEARTVTVMLADGSRSKVPVVEPLKIQYKDYTTTHPALALGNDRCLLGVIPIQALRLLVNPNTHTLEYDPRAEYV